MDNTASKPMRLADETRQRALPRRLNFTVDALKQLACPPGKDRIWVYDSRQPRLALMVTPNGTKTFYVYKRVGVGKKPERNRLDKFPDISIEQARKLAAQMVGKIADGEDPMEAKRQARLGSTLGELWEHWKENHAEARLAQSTIDTDTYRYDSCLKDWAGRKLKDIRKRDVDSLHAKLGESIGHVTANRAIQLMRRLYGYANRQGLGLEDPTAGVVMFKENPRERYVTAAELPKLFAAIEQEEPLFRDFFILCLLTGARRRNVQAMRWDQIDLPAATWAIPGKQAKARRVINVPLSPEAVKILKDRFKLREEESPWVFPSRGTSGYLTDPTSAWDRILSRAGIEDLHIHDLRRTLGSWQAAQGTSLLIIGKSLGHQSTRSTEIYSKLHLDPVRASVNLATDAMFGVVKAAKKKAKKKGEDGK